MTLVNPSEECMRSVYKQFNTSKEQVKEDVQLIKDWLRDQPHLPHIQDDVCLEGMLLRCKFSVERAKQAWDMIFTLKTALPEIFSNRDPMGADIQAVLNGLNVAPMPDVTSDGYRVIILKCLSKDATLFNPEAFAKCAFMVTDIRIGEDKSVGDIYIYDMENVTIGHISRMTLPMFKKLEMISSEGYKSRIKGVHFINAPPVMDVLMTMIKKFIKSKLAARHHVHTTLTSLYEHVDREVLPVEYGGQASSCFEIGANWKKKLESNRDWFQQQDLVGKADESKRPGKSFNSSEFFGFEGTFKKLCVD